MSFVALFNKYLLNKDILLSFSRVTSVPGHSRIPQTCTALRPILILSLLSFAPKTFETENAYIFSVKRMCN